MPIAEVLDLLRCPVCGQAFTLVGPGVRCPRGHLFDLARQGYLNLLQSRPPRHADTAEMVAARERFLGGGHYRPVAEHLVAAVRGGLSAVRRDAEPPLLSILDAGAGSGYYLGVLLDDVSGRGVALDISIAAARRAARAHPRIASVVADTWQRLPLADHGFDVVTSVFAPRNAEEFARVVRPDGLLVVVSPLADHLAELRQGLGLLEVQEDKQARLDAVLSDRFVRLDEQPLRQESAWTHPVVLDLIGMGPNAFHLDAGQRAERLRGLPDPVSVRVAVSVSTWTPRPG